MNKSKKIAVTGVLSALAFAFTAVGRVPVVLFLKYDPKDVVLTLGGLIWGPFTALAASAVSAFLEMVSLSDTGLIGFVMNVVSSGVFACTAAAVYRRKRSIRTAVLGLVLGALSMTAVMLLWNYLVAPLYMGIPREEIKKLLLPAFLPFNLLKGGLNAAFTFLLYKPAVRALRRSGLAEPSESSEKGRRSGWLLPAALIALSGILFLLSRGGVL